MCIMILVVGRFVNAALPWTLGALVATLESQYGGGSQSPVPRSFWPYLFGYVGLRFLQGSGGLNAIRDVGP